MKNEMPTKSVTAWAPATIGNVAVGFDILGMAIEGVGDQIRLTPRRDRKIMIQSITGVLTSSELPLDAEKNTAGAALIALQEGEGLKVGFDVHIHKGIPLGSGMGGSAASAVAAVIAAQKWLSKKLSVKQKLFYALEGERVASGAAHPDNVAPCLMGGLVLASLKFGEPIVELPFPSMMGWMLVHPNIKVETKLARSILKPQIDLSMHVEQSSYLSCFLSGLYKNDLSLIQQGFQDILIEPQRAALIPNFERIKKQALALKGVLGFSISGSGPSLFSLTRNKLVAKKLAHQVQQEFLRNGIESQIYYGQGGSPGARIMPGSRKSHKKEPQG